MPTNLFEKLFARYRSAAEAMNRKYSLVGDSPFFDTAQFAWVPAFRQYAPAIAQELDRVMARVDELPNFHDIIPDATKGIVRATNWKTYFFYGAGKRINRNCEECPQTALALSHIPGMTSAFFSVLAPGTHIARHRGPYNGVLRLHLGLKIPDTSPDVCGIDVGGVQRGWSPAEVLLFDDSYEHEVWNITNHHRVVLFVDFLRPLPFGISHLNKLMAWVFSKTRFVTDGRANQDAWQKKFYRKRS